MAIQGGRVMVEIEEGNNGNGEQSKTNIIAEMTRRGQPESVHEMIEFIEGVERAEGFPQERIDEIRIALQEAFRNVLESSYRDKGGDILVTCKHDPWGKFMIVISDSGEPSNLLLADVVFAGEDEPVDQKKKASARLIKKMIDNVEYKRVDNMNVFTFSVAPRPRTR
jgi:anti-sigma regulatory factor (Ser/Thr protein kinase)